MALPPGTRLRLKDLVFLFLAAIYELGARCRRGSERTGIENAWNELTGRGPRTLRGHTEFVKRLVFSPNGRSLATSSFDATLRFWDVGSGRTIQTVPNPMRNPHVGNDDFSGAFDAEGHVLATSWDNRWVKMWDVSTGSVLHTFEEHPSTVTAVALNSRATMLASACGEEKGQIRLWEVKTGRAVHAVQTSLKLEALTFSPDSRMLAVASEPSLIWDVSAGRTVHSLDHPFKSRNNSEREEGGFATGVAFSPDGRLLALAHDMTTEVSVWDVATGRKVWRLESSEGWWVGALDDLPDTPATVAFRSDGQLLFAHACGSSVKLWVEAVSAA